jgi:hypothetical protein
MQTFFTTTKDEKTEKAATGCFGSISIHSSSKHAFSSGAMQHEI